MLGAPLDLTSIVDDIVAHPLDRRALHRAQASVDGPLSYARALRAAAKRTGDCKAAAFWFLEAARVHESLDDPGGAIALLTRAWDCDPGNERTRQLTAALLTRVAERVGLTFVAHASDPVASSPRTAERLSSHEQPMPSAPSLPSATNTVYRDVPEGESVARPVTATRARKVSERPTGDRLIGHLFEALQRLRFIEDIAEGAAYVLQVVVEKTRAQIGLIHLYDIESDEFVVVSAIAKRHRALVDWNTPGNDRFVAELMRSGEPVFIRHPLRDARFTQGRWALAEPRRSILCAPAARQGRALGLIEIADPSDGTEFTDDDRQPLSYAAAAFGDFVLDRRGVSSSIRVHPDRSWPPRRRASSV